MIISNDKIKKEKFDDDVSKIKQEKKLNEEIFDQVNNCIKEDYRLLEDFSCAVKGEKVDNIIDEIDNNLRNITKKNINNYEESVESLNKRQARLESEHEKNNPKEGEE